MQGIKDPLFDLLLYMQSYDDNGLDNKKFKRLYKNLRTNFTKLFLSIDMIIKHKEKKLDFENELLRVQTVEYCFLKISTIWDLAYTITHKHLLHYGKHEKYSKLEEEFNMYGTDDLKFLNLSWYHDINKIRNSIVHGGVNITTFYENNQLFFNAYDENIDTIIPHCSIYSKQNGLMVYADKYFIYYIGILYNYLNDFFKYVLRKVKVSNPSIREFNEFEMEYFSKSSHWTFLNLDSYNEYALKNFNLPLQSKRDEYIINRLNIKRFTDEAGSIGFQKNMITSIVDKYNVIYEWINENDIKIIMNYESLQIFELIIEDIKDIAGFQSSPNIEESHWILSFNFYPSSYELFY